MDFSGHRVLVVGDIMLDKYYFGKVERVSPEAPVPVVSVTREETRLGGAANVACNISSLGGTPLLVGAVGRDLEGKEVERIAAREGIQATLLKTACPTTVKARIIGGRQQIARVDREQQTRLDPREIARLESEIEKATTNARLVIISDYGKGLVTGALCDLLSRQQATVIIDPKGANWDKYRGADWVTPNLKELSDVAGQPVENDDRTIEKTGREILRRHDIRHLLVTRSERGMTLLSGEETLHVPTRAREVFDVCGAGDTVVATLALALASGIPAIEAIHLANKAAGIVVQKTGTATITIEELNAPG
ncbi:MAG: D-glycero-beta-D-manno-heptose-7-phosphate kinase [Odoribacteraceae bacterium]|jgi:D-beta-D-heptose 7-phosphate kinase/D-beta-D-heptose 1-phosphate adenosyltransferase|nr:D-glycero-beta-D-manno-heptose-7-phosphate kinase [Odoribacteraceae bacterium]